DMFTGCFGEICNDAHGFGKLSRGHVIEQHSVDWFGERFAQLFEGIDLDFNFDHVAHLDACGCNCRVDRTCDQQVIVLDEDSIVEAKTVIASAAAAHGIFLQDAQSRECLAGAHDMCICAGNNVN